MDGGHYEAGLGTKSPSVRRAVIEVDRLGGLGTGFRSSELGLKLTRVQELAVVPDLVSEPVESRMAATGGGDVGSLHLGRERRRPETA